MAGWACKRGPAPYCCRMRLPWRLTEIWQKTLYIVVGWAVLALFFLGLRTWLLDQHSWPYGLIGFVVNIGYNLVGVRIFRGYHEPVAGPRAWWRWTGRPKAGFWLGGLQLFGVLSFVQDFWPRHGLPPDLANGILNIVSSLVLGIGYLNSSFRLRRHPELWSARRPKRRDQQLPTWKSRNLDL